MILLKNLLLSGEETDVLIDGGRFRKIAPAIDAAIMPPGSETIDASGLAILPPFCNAHTHAAMTLLRGYADDMELFKWLNEHIWPFEKRLTARDIYEGSRLAILEMIRSGTVFFNDMYFESAETVRAARELGVRACVGMTVTNFTGEEKIARMLQTLESLPKGGHVGDDGLVRFTLAPHAVYTVSEALWRNCSEFARERNLLLHIHLSETQKEVADCVSEHGMTPVRWLDALGVLGENVVAAHVVHVDDEEIAILRERGVTLVHNPVSNMKLSSGIFRTQVVADAGCKITLGTDGTASNNNLDMREEMKFAALLAKVPGQPDAAPAESVLRWATSDGFRAFGIDSGEIAEGKLADAILVDLRNERMIPNHSLISNWVYSADSRCIRYVFCDGKILMRDGVIPFEEEILDAVQSVSILAK